MDLVVPLGGQVHFFEGLLHLRLLLRIRNSPQPGVEVEMLFDGERGPQDVELRTHSHLEMDLIDLVLDRVAADEGAAGGGGEDASDHGEEGGLARAVGSEQAEDDLVLHDQVQVVDCELATRVLLGEAAADERVLGQIIDLADSGAFLVDGGVALVLDHVVELDAVLPLLELVDEIVYGEEDGLVHSELLRDDLVQVHPHQAEDEEGEVQHRDALPHLRSNAVQCFGALVHRAVGEHQVEQSVEGEGRPHGKAQGQLAGILEERDAESSADEVGPDGDEVADDVGSPTGAEEDLEEHGESDLGEDPAEEDDGDDGETHLLEEGVLEEEVAVRVEDHVGQDADDQVVEEVDGPVVQHPHPVHPHHLDQPLLLLQHGQVEEHRQQQAQREREDDRSHRVDQHLDEDPALLAERHIRVAGYHGFAGCVFDIRGADHVHHAEEPFGNGVERSVVGTVDIRLHPDLSHSVGTVEQKLSDILDPQDGLESRVVGYFEVDGSVGKHLGGGRVPQRVEGVVVEILIPFEELIIDGGVGGQELRGHAIGKRVKVQRIIVGHVAVERIWNDPEHA